MPCVNPSRRADSRRLFDKLTLWPAYIAGLLLYAAPVLAADIEVLALFRDQVVIRIDGVQHRLRPGESTPDGIKLIDSDGSGARLEIDGVQRRYPLGAKIRSNYKKTAQPEVQIFRDGNGMFFTVGSVNGLPMRFLVDTGATTIAMSSVQARRLGIDYRVVGEPAQVITASRVEPVYAVMLNTVKVGDITLHNVRATVMEGAMPDIPLLGMSFLGRLEMVNDGQKLILRKKY